MAVKHKKIVFIIPNMTGGGTERVISLLSNEYIAKGFEVAVMQFAGYEHAYSLNEKVEDFSVAPKSNGNPFIMVKRLLAMRRYFQKNRDCYIFAFCVMGAVFSVITTWGMKLPIMVAERNSPDSCNVKALRNWAYRRAGRITFQTADGISYFPEEIAKKAVVIPNPVDADMPKPYTGNRSHRVVTAGRLHHQKNHALLLDAFADFVEKFPDYELHIYGEGELEGRLREQAKRLGIASRVVWHGFCPDVREQIKDAAMFVLSSDYEGLSNTMLEALSMGIPTISTDCPIGGARIYITPEESGLLVPVGDKAAMSGAMCRIASDGELAKRLSEGAAQIRENYSVEKIAEKFLEAAGLCGRPEIPEDTGKRNL